MIIFHHRTDDFWIYVITSLVIGWSTRSLARCTMAPLADFLLSYVPLPTLPPYLTSFIPGQTPLSTFPAVVTSLVGYLAAIFGIQAIMIDRRPKTLQFIFQAHNAILSAGSLLLLALLLEEIIPVWWNQGLFAALCAEGSWNSVCLSISPPGYC
jgi:fatty acid elongase 3